jgi:pSer/pThr/pTyr-binding forkhead associated (FHA) protein
MQMTSPQELDEQATAALDAVACLDERVRKCALSAAPSEPGRYLELQGPADSVLIPLHTGVLHIGRGLSADLRLDDTSVSRRHAILVNRGPGARILDDRSLHGTLVNGQRISQRDLSDGDILVVGRVLMRYLEVSRRSAPSEPASCADSLAA